jgi:DNA-binding transcriptional regulator YdaS (Cro superfamily)
MQAINQAIEKAGGPSRLAALLGVTTQAVCFWRDGKRSVPTDKMAEIEKACGFAVMRWHLRPDDWHRIWPELVGTEGAPSLPTTQQEL